MPGSRLDDSFSLFAAVALLVGSFGFAACGDGGGEDINPFPDTSVDTGEPGDVDAGDPGCSSDSECSDPTPVCDEESGACVECSEDGDCSSGENCDTETNECVAVQCGEGTAGQSCSSDAQTARGWRCVNAGKGPVCMRTCTQGEDGEGGSCDGPEICMQTGEAADTAVCFPSQCQGPTDTQNCSNANSEHARFGSFENGAKCANYSENALVPPAVSDSLEDCGSATLCVPSGTQGTGESCNILTPGDCPDGADCQACNAQNTCLDGTCRNICSAASDCGAEGESCVGLGDSNVVGEQVGFCGEACQPFDGEDDCSASGEGCKRVSDTVGYCGEVGSKTNMQECETGENECAEGFSCQGLRQTIGGGVVARCLPNCVPSGGGDDQVLDNHATCGGTFHGRAAYAHDDPSEIDLYANGERKVDDLATGMVDAGMNSATPNYFTLDVDRLNRGQVAVDVTDGAASDASNPLVSTDLIASSGLVQTWLVHSTGSLQVAPIPSLRGVEKPGESSGRARIRAGTVVPDFESGGSTVNVDIVAVPQGGNLSANGILLAEDLQAGAVGVDFVEVDSGNYSLFVFPESASNESGNELVEVSGLTAGEGKRMTFVLTGTVDETDDLDVSATKLSYASAPSAPRYRCVGLGQGLCLNQCRNQEFGTDWCDPNSSCAPLQGTSAPSYCLPDGDATRAPGDSCTPSLLSPPCEEGASCVVDGSGSGKCRSLCVGGSEDADGTLSCGSGETCASGEGVLGQCQTGCSPGDNQEDTSCPENLQACIEEFAGEGQGRRAFCSPSGPNEEGEECGGDGDPLTALTQNCEPGTLCAHSTGVADSTNLAILGMFFQKPLVSSGVCRQSVDSPTAPQATCRPTCEPFAEDPGCPDGQACGLDLSNDSGLNGVCLEKAENVENPARGTMCGDNAGKLCGHASYCAPQLAGGGSVRRCLEFCNFNTGEGCTEGECENSGLSTGVGICVQ